MPDFKTNLLGYYSLNNNLTASHGQNGTQVPVGGGTMFNNFPGKNNYCASIPSVSSGTKAYIDLGGQYNFSSSFTVSMWIKCNSITDGALFSRYHSSSGYKCYQMGVTINGALYLETSSDGINVTRITTANNLVVQNGFIGTTWQHIVFTKNGSSAAIYLNGVSKKTGTLSTNIKRQYNTTEFTTMVGCVSKNNSGTLMGDGYFGYIDEIGVWCYGMSSTEVSSLYNGGSGTFFGSFTGTLSDPSTLLPPITPDPIYQGAYVNTVYFNNTGGLGQFIIWFTNTGNYSVGTYGMVVESSLDQVNWSPTFTWNESQMVAVSNNGWKSTIDLPFAIQNNQEWYFRYKTTKNGQSTNWSTYMPLGGSSISLATLTLPMNKSLVSTNISNYSVTLDMLMCYTPNLCNANGLPFGFWFWGQGTSSYGMSVERKSNGVWSVLYSGSWYNSPFTYNSGHIYYTDYSAQPNNTYTYRVRAITIGCSPNCQGIYGPELVVTTPNQSSTLNVLENSLYFDGNGYPCSQDYMTVQCSTNWSCYFSNSWASISPSMGSGNGTVYIMVQPNYDMSTRSASVIFSSPGSPNDSCYIVQYGWSQGCY